MRVRVPARGTVEQKIAILSGRTTGEPATGGQVVAALLNPAAKDAPKLAAAIQARVSPESWSLVKQGIWKLVSEAPEGATAWGHQRTGETIAKLATAERR